MTGLVSDVVERQPVAVAERSTFTAGAEPTVTAIDCVDGETNAARRALLCVDGGGIAIDTVSLPLPLVVTPGARGTAAEPADPLPPHEVKAAIQHKARAR
jgi:hypothetical protein